MELEFVKVKFDEKRGVFLIEIQTSNNWGEGSNVHTLFKDMKLPEGIKNEVLEKLNSAEIKV